MRLKNEKVSCALNRDGASHMVKDSPGEDDEDSAEAQAHAYDREHYRMDKIQEEWDNILMSSPSTSRGKLPALLRAYEEEDVREEAMILWMSAPTYAVLCEQHQTALFSGDAVRLILLTFSLRLLLTPFKSCTPRPSSSQAEGPAGRASPVAEIRGQTPLFLLDPDVCRILLTLSSTRADN
jgi:hypothetical protein